MLIRIVSGNGWLAISPFTLTRIYSALIVFPPFFSMWLVLAALLPKVWMGDESFYAAHLAPAHEFHLFGDITQKFEPFLAVATAILIFTIVAIAISKAIHAYLRLGGILESLEFKETSPANNQIEIVEEVTRRKQIQVGLIANDRPFTFVWGVWNTKLIISSGLLGLLSPAELRGVVEHEAAHHTRRDNPVKLSLSALSYFSLAFPLSRQVLKWHSEQIELVCDEVASARTGTPLEIASALVKLSRHSNAVLTPMPVMASTFLVRGEKGIEKRVRRLIHLDDALGELREAVHLERSPKIEFGSVLLVFLATLISVMAFAPLSVHQASESLFHMIK